MKPAGDVQPFLPYGRQVIEDDDLDAVREALLSPMLTTGPLVGRFEADFAAATSAQDAVVVSNGTAALHLAARAIKLDRGQAAIVPSVTFVATANAVRYCGAEAIFADVDPLTGLMTPQTLTDALRRAPGTTRAVFPVHLNGPSCDMAGIAAVARNWGLWVIEDACHAVGGTQGPDAAPVGACAFSDLACFSFHPVKTIAMGEGGAITTNHADLAAAMRRDRSHGLIREAEAFRLPEATQDNDGAANPWFYELHQPGFNYRAPDLLCALGISQLKKLARFVRQRRELVALYRAALAPLAPLVECPADPAHGEAGWHLFAVLIDFARAGISRAKVMARLAEAGIGSQVHYIPVHRQPYYAARMPGLDLPGADAYYARCLSLPLFAAMTEADVLRVAKALTEALDA